jgi:hypothetical protein
MPQEYGCRYQLANHLVPHESPKARFAAGNRLVGVNVQAMPGTTGIPDMHSTNGQVPIIKVARELDLRLDSAGKIHCWHGQPHNSAR